MRVRQAYMKPMWEEVGFEVTEAGQRDTNLLDERAVAPDEVLAEVAGRKLLESDLRWFLKDALIPEQRAAAYSRQSARQSLLTSFLGMLVLEAKARRESIDRSEEFIHRRAGMRRRLLIEFVQ